MTSVSPNRGCVTATKGAWAPIGAYAGVGEDGGGDARLKPRQEAVSHPQRRFLGPKLPNYAPRLIEKGHLALHVPQNDPFRTANSANGHVNGV